MAAYDPYDHPYDSPTRDRRYDDRGARYADTRDSPHLKVYPASRDLVPRHRENSDLSVEEVSRDFPPPGYRDVRRARSAEPGYYDYAYDSREPRYERDQRQHRSRRGPDSVYYEEEERRKRMLSKQEKILAAFAGAALALGGKEVYDRHEAKEKDSPEIERNYLQSAALGAAGAFAGYQGAELYNKHAGKEEKKTYALHRGRDGRIQEYYYSDDDDDMPAKKGHKKFLESVLGVTSVGAAMKALTGDDSRSSRGRGRSRSSSRSSRSRGHSRSKLQKAAMASLIAGATEAFRVSKEPGGWKGEKAKRVVTAALGAGALGTAHDEGHSKKDIFESVVGGLLGNRLVHGSKKNIEEDERDPGRSRSRSRARSEGGRGGGGGGLAALATAGLGALAAKKAADSRSRSRSRRRGSSVDSRSSNRRRQRSRSRSVVDKARKGLAKIGLGSGPESDHDDYEGSRHGSSRRRDRPRGYADDYYDDDDFRAPSRRDRSRDRDSAAGYYDDYRSERPSRRRGDRSESDLGDSSDDERRAKKMKGKQILTTGLATVATIHAAHEVYESMSKRTARRKAVKEGRLSPEEAKKLKTKAMLQDAASVGIAALGIKGAVSELKEAREIAHECREFQREKKARQQRRRERQWRLNSGQNRRRADNYSSSATPRPERHRDADYGYDYNSDYGDYGPDYYDNDRYYADGNPYSAALPAPPVGYGDRR